jgi:hypothetical protein
MNMEAGSGATFKYSPGTVGIPFRIVAQIWRLMLDNLGLLAPFPSLALGHYSYRIKEQYKPSATLVSTVLQLCTTPWLHTVWSKNDIYFIKGGEASLTDQLYVHKPEDAPK